MTVQELNELSRKLECEIVMNMHTTNDRDELVKLYFEVEEIEDMLYKKLDDVNARNYWIMSALYDLSYSMCLQLREMIKINKISAYSVGVILESIT